jgi:hypothetical protein
MTNTVSLKGVKWRHSLIEGNFPVIKEFRKTQDDGSGVITIDGSSLGYPDKIRLSVHPTQLDENYTATLNTLPTKTNENNDETIESLRAASALKMNVPLEGDWNGETEEQAIERIGERFKILNEMTEAISLGHVKSMIVSGPPGVGKSFGVEEELLRASMFEMLGNKKLKHEFVKGSVSPIGLYKKLHEFSDKNCVVVFDDCDDVLLDPVSLSLLKAALDTSKRRYLSWNKESYMLLREHVSDRFEFQGGIVFITNLDFTSVRSKILKPHLDAMMSRCHYLSLDINTVRDKYLRIKAVVKKSEMLDDYYFENNEQDLILDYLKANVSRFQEISLRTVLKLADLVKMKKGVNWQRIADVTLMKKGS